MLTISLVFCAVIVRNDTIIAEEWSEVTSSNDPTAHAEIVAIRRACTLLRGFSLLDCDIYTSCEPCPMCLGAIYWRGCDASTTRIRGPTQCGSALMMGSFTAK